MKPRGRPLIEVLFDEEHRTMPSALPQLNVRVKPEVIEALTALCAALAKERGCAISQSAVIAEAITRMTRALKIGPKKAKENP